MVPPAKHTRPRMQRARIIRPVHAAAPAGSQYREHAHCILVAGSQIGEALHGSIACKPEPSVTAMTRFDLVPSYSLTVQTLQIDTVWFDGRILCAVWSLRAQRSFRTSHPDGSIGGRDMGSDARGETSG